MCSNVQHAATHELLSAHRAAGVLGTARRCIKVYASEELRMHSDVLYYSRSMLLQSVESTMSFLGITAT
jgi:hypothetical protein